MISLRLNGKEILKVKKGGSIRVGPEHVSVGLPAPNVHLNVDAPIFKRFAQLQHAGKRFILKPEMIKQALVSTVEGGALPLTEYVGVVKRGARKAKDVVEDAVEVAEDALEKAKSVTKRGRRMVTGGYIDPDLVESAVAVIKKQKSGGKITAKSLGRAVSKVSKAVKENQGEIARAYNGIDALAHDAISTAKGGSVASTFKSIGKKITSGIKNNSGIIGAVAGDQIGRIAGSSAVGAVAGSQISKGLNKIGGKLVKGSQEAKDRMARIRSMKKGGQGITGGGIYGGR